MEILADQNVPEKYVSALRGDGHTVRYTRDVAELGPRAADNAICGIYRGGDPLHRPARFQ